MPDKPIRFVNRATGVVEVESVYGERWLRWTYGTAPGGCLLRAVVRRTWFSHWYGWRMRRSSSRSRVDPFVRDYGIDVSEFAESLESFQSFNDFFIRKLKPAARPIAGDELTAVLPADGRHLVVPEVGIGTVFYAKGQRFNLERFLGDAALARRFYGGVLSLSRLCPVDYHRFHFPVAGIPGAPRLLKGALYSVSPIALRRNLDYLWRNKRFVSVLETTCFGRIAIVEIGATCVGSVVHTARSDVPVGRGDEKGYFQFGGSCVALLFEPGRLRPAEDLVANSAQGMETYSRMGEVLGTAGAGRDVGMTSERSTL